MRILRNKTFTKRKGQKITEKEWSSWSSMQMIRMMKINEAHGTECLQRSRKEGRLGKKNKEDKSMYITSKKKISKHTQQLPV